MEGIKIQMTGRRREMIDQLSDYVKEDLSYDRGEEWAKLSLYFYEEDYGQTLNKINDISSPQESIYEWSEDLAQKMGYELDYNSRDSLYKTIIESTKYWDSGIKENYQDDLDDIENEMLDYVGKDLSLIRKGMKSLGFKLKREEARGLSLIFRLESKDGIPGKTKYALGIHKLLEKTGFKESVWDRSEQAFQYVKSGQFSLLSSVLIGINGIEVMVTVE